MIEKPLVALLLILLVVSPAPGQSESEVVRLQAENARLREEIAAMEVELARLRIDNHELHQQKNRLSELAGLTPTGQRVKSKRALIEQIYKSAHDKTIVRSKPEKLMMTRGTKMSHYMTVAYAHEGKDPAGNRPAVRWHIHSKFTGGIYQGEQGLCLLVDGVDAYISITDYRRRKRQSSIAGKRRVNKDDETMTMAMDDELLRQIASATEVQGAIKNIQFTLSLDQIATFQAMRKRIELGWDEDVGQQ